MHWLDEPATISDTDRAAFERDGHVTLRGLMPPAEQTRDRTDLGPSNVG